MSEISAIGGLTGFCYGEEASIGKAAAANDVPVGEHQIVVVKVESDYALIILEKSDSHYYYKIERGDVLNFEDISHATKVFKVNEGDLKYAEFR